MIHEQRELLIGEREANGFRVIDKYLLSDHRASHYFSLP